MFIEPRNTPKIINATVAVVGSGPAGLSLAMDLATAGVDVAMLESGLRNQSAFAASLARAEQTPDHHILLERLGGRRFGGLSWSWGGRCVAYDPIDFEQRPNAGAPGWPIAREEIMRRADAAVEFLGVGAPEFSAPIKCIESGGDIVAALERWCSEPQLAQRHVNSIRASSKLKAYLGVTCSGADIDGDGRVRRLSAVTADGRKVCVEATHFVLAAGGVETARLMLWFFEQLATCARPKWLGRGYMGHLKGQIADVKLDRKTAGAFDYKREGNSCFTRRRIGFSAATLRREKLLNIAFHIDNPPIGNPDHKSAALSSMALALSMPGIGHMLAREPMRSVLLGGALNRKHLGGHVWNLLSRPWDAGLFGFTAVRGRFTKPKRPGVIAGHSTGKYALAYYAEQSAQYENAVTLSSLRDAAGLPRIKIAQAIQDFDMESILRAHSLLAKTLSLNAGFSVDYRAAPEHRHDAIVEQCGDGYHQIGLARMGDDPSTSVVDTDAKVRNLKNLFVAGSAVFPTSGQANPTFTIVCQALRLSEHLTCLIRSPSDQIVSCQSEKLTV